MASADRKVLLQSVDLKLARAAAQADSLASQVSAWTQTQPIKGECRLRDGRLGFRLIMSDFSEPAPLHDWGLQAGECIHNLRSSLDNLAFALARIERDPPAKPRQVAFPIYIDKLEYEKNGSGQRQIAQLPSAARDLIYRMQPFQRTGPDGMPDTDPLLLLQWLNNNDKHQVPAVVLLAPAEIRHQATCQFYSEEDAAANVPPNGIVWGGPIKPGVVLFEHITTKPVKSVSGDFACRAVIALETPKEPAPLVKILLELHGYVALVVSQFRHFFEVPPRA